MSHRRILWSGGFDSTLLVLSALISGDTVTPVLAPMGDLSWQKMRRERAARDAIRAALPFGLRTRLHAAADTSQDLLTTQAPFWRDYQHFLDELNTRRHDCGQTLASGYNAKLPMLLAVANALDPTPRRIEAAFVSTDFSMQDPASRDLLSTQLLLPFARVSKTALLIQHPALASLLALTWSCEALPETAADGLLSATTLIPACGLCDACLARVIPQRPLCR